MAAPTLATLSNVTLFAGAPLHIALDGFDADGDTLTFSATSDNGNLGLTIPTGNRSMKITVAHAPSSDPTDKAISGDMIFQLFDDLAPATAARIAQLAQQGFYNGLTFHRIASPGNPFVIQGGDPLGTGTGGSGVDFDDEFNTLLQHTSKGILSMAKSTDDTNDSQFFITATDTRHLDFNHSIFGFLTEGESVRADVQNVPVGANDKPKSPVFMQNVSVFVDRENGVLRLSAPAGTTGTANVTVTVDDGNGGTAQRTFQVTILPDTGMNSNSRPFLNPTPPSITLPRSGSTTIEVTATDVEGGQMIFSTVSALAGFNITLESAVVQPVGQIGTAKYTITNTTAPVGTYTVRLAVRDGDQASNASTADSQLLTIHVVAIQLLNDNGASTTDLVTDRNNTPGKLMQFRVGAVDVGAQIVLKAGNDIIGTGTAGSDGMATITTNGTVPLADGAHAITAFRDNNGTLTQLFDAITVTIDTTAPIFSSSPPLVAVAGSSYNYNAQTNEEGSLGFVYELLQHPAGMTINASTGQVTWIPTIAQPNAHAVVVRARDQFGAFTDQQFEVFVRVPPTLAAIADQSLPELDAFSLTITASDANTPSGPITYSFASAAPSGAAIGASSGVFTWTPTEAQGPGTYDITIRATDETGLFADRVVRFVVGEVNLAPTLQPLGDRVVEEGATLFFSALALDPDLPVQTLTYSLAPGAPEGATIDAATGAFSFVPNELQGGQTFTVEVRVSDGLGGSDAKSFSIDVIETNQPPTIAPIPTQLVSQGDLVTFTVVAADADVPIQTLSFSLGDDAPEGATIDPATGVFTWQTAEDEESTEIQFTVIVTDSAGFASSRLVTVRVGNDAPLALFPGGPFTAEVADTLSLVDGAVLPRVLPLASTVAPLGHGFFAEPPEFTAGAPNYRFGPDTGVQALVPPLERYEVQRPSEEQGEKAKQEAKEARPVESLNQENRGAGAAHAQPVSGDAPAAETEPSESEIHEAAVAALDLAQADVVLEVLLNDRAEVAEFSFGLRNRSSAAPADSLAAVAREAHTPAASKHSPTEAKLDSTATPTADSSTTRQKLVPARGVQAATVSVMFPLLVTEIARRDDRAQGARDIGPWRWRRS